MKKNFIACVCFLLCLLLSFSLIACNGNEEEPKCPIADGVHIRFAISEYDGTYTEIINETHIADIKIVPDQNNADYWVIQFTLTQEGTEIFAIASEEYVGQQVAILLTPPNGAEDYFTSRIISGAITNGILVLAGNFDLETAQDFYSYLTTGHSLSYWKYYEETGEFPPQ